MALTSGAGDLYKGFLRKQSLLTFVDLQHHDHVSHHGTAKHTGLVLQIQDKLIDLH